MRLNVFVGYPGSHSILTPHLTSNTATPAAPFNDLKASIVADFPEKMYFVFGARDRDGIILNDTWEDKMARWFTDADATEAILGMSVAMPQFNVVLWNKAPAGTRFFIFKHATDSHAPYIRRFSEQISSVEHATSKTFGSETAFANDDQAAAWEQDKSQILHAPKPFKRFWQGEENIPDWQNFDNLFFRGGAEPATSDVLVRVWTKE